MNNQDFVGKTCPYCKTGFSDEDDIVVCSDCEMPHHKSCWVENQGCTTFGCSGTFQRIDEPAPAWETAGSAASFEAQSSPSEEQPAGAVHFCPRCGTKCDAEHVFCAGCGYRFTPSQQSASNPAPPPNAFSSSNTQGQQPHQEEVDYEALLIVENVHYYKMKFDSMRRLNRATSWNWPAFFVSGFWCIYRKMYGLGVGVWVASIVLSFFGTIGSLFALIGQIIFAMFANNLYMKHIEKLVLAAHSMQEPYKNMLIQKKAGVNIPVIVIFIVIYILMVILAYSSYWSY